MLLLANISHTFDKSHETHEWNIIQTLQIMKIPPAKILQMTYRYPTKKQQGQSSFLITEITAHLSGKKYSTWPNLLILPRAPQNILEIHLIRSNR